MLKSNNSDLHSHKYAKIEINLGDDLPLEYIYIYFFSSKLL